MIKLEPKDRFTIPQLLGHPWLKDSEDEEPDEEEDDELPSNRDKKSGGNGFV